MYKQLAHGTFSVEVTGANHCGPDNVSPKTFEYRLGLVYPATALDARGFLLDNTTFRDYFEHIGTVDYSCENLARKACSDLFKLTAGRATRVHVMISPMEGVWVDCIYPDSPN